jgi:S1-C subfamily serine protease
MVEMPRQTYDGSSDSKSTMALATGHGTGHRAALGIVPDFNSVESQNGVAISGVRQASPADKAGLKGGDVITRFNDKSMNNLQDLSDALSQANPGDKIILKVLRQGKTLQLQATLEERQE